MNDAHVSIRRRLLVFMICSLLLTVTCAAIVTYCSNPACRNSDIAARQLIALGYTNVRKYADGKDDWHDAGLPHISKAGSLLWPRPIACPSSWAITLRGTLGSDIGGPLVLRIITTAPRPSANRLAFDMNSPSDNTT